MATTKTYFTVGWEDRPATFYARVEYDNAGDATNITQAAVSTITYAVYTSGGAAVSGASGSLTVSSVVFNTLQTGDAWSADSTGYNFRTRLAGTCFPDVDSYRVVFTFTLSGSGDVLPVRFIHETESVT